MMALPSSTEKPTSPADRHFVSLSIVNSERWARPELVRSLQPYVQPYRRFPRRERLMRRNSLTTRLHPSYLNALPRRNPPSVSKRRRPALDRHPAVDTKGVQRPR